MIPKEWHAHLPGALPQRHESLPPSSIENKYAHQTGLKDLDFDFNLDALQQRGFTLPFHSIGQAEQALLGRLICPNRFVEFDGTGHTVLVFHPQPVGYSGFMGCVTHSLALTDLGLFEVGRFPAIRMDQSGKYWQWFLHCRLAPPEQVSAWQAEGQLNAGQLVDSIYRAITGL